MAHSFMLIYYPSKIFHIANAAEVTIGAYFVFCFVNIASIYLPYSIILAIFASVILGVMCEVLVYRKMRTYKTPNYSYFIASIGLYEVLQNFISVVFGDEALAIETTSVTIGHQILGAYLTNIQILSVVVSLFLIVPVNLFLHFTPTGKSIRAVSSNPELCNIYGISSKKVIIIAFALASALAAVAGILSAMDTNMTPTFGFNLLLYGAVAMIIGGVGSTKGFLAGSLLVATAQHLAAFYLDTKWMDAVTYIILILFLIWKPLGFSGKRLKKVEV
jgi:branched-chain amino acid transport system permease protein